MDENNTLDIEQSVPSDSVVSEPDSAIIEIGSLDYTIENPLPVLIVEEDTESEVEEEYEVEVFASTGSAVGTISDTYLNYFEGIVEKLSFQDDYVVWKSGEYSYSMAYGDLELEDSIVYGNDLECVRLYRDSSSYNSNWYTKFEELESLDLETESLYVYSNLGDFPTLQRGFRGYEAETLIFALVVMFLFGVLSDIFASVRRIGRR